VTERAPAKVNLCLFVGPTREDGRHELVSVMQSIGLYDTVRLEPAPLGATADRVVCPGVEGDNLALAALRAFRARTGAPRPPVTLHIDKRIPVAAGMAGGSADAAAALRLAARAAGVEDDALLREVAATLGADVPAQVRPGRWLATGAGEVLEPLPPAPSCGVLVLPSHEALSTPAVYRELDALGLQRSPADLRARLQEVRAHGAALPAALCVNDLEPAARSLCPAIDEALAAARAAGARVAMVSGSGPTVIGLFDGLEAARGAAVMLAGRDPRPVAVAPVR
jgi:4-diphosphocytidyl-2-C-methyl-D-erythritol kinase